MAKKSRRNRMRMCGTCKHNTSGSCAKRMPLYPNVRSCHGWERDDIAAPIILLPNNIKKEEKKKEPLEEFIMSNVDKNKCLRYCYFPAE